MNHFRMSGVEKEILADIGKLALFVRRSTGMKSTELSPDLKHEYDQILKQYDRVPFRYPYSQVNNILKSILKTLTHDMKSLDRHDPIELDVKKGVIVSVLCSCGEFTKYKVPLRLISDFECPKEGRV